MQLSRSKNEREFYIGFNKEQKYQKIDKANETTAKPRSYRMCDKLLQILTQWWAYSFSSLFILDVAT